MNKIEGMNYAPKGKPNPVVKSGEFHFAAMALDHGHIYGITNGLLEAGATLKYVYDPDYNKSKEFQKTYPQVKIANSPAEILQDIEIKLVAGAAIPSNRCELGLQVLSSGKNYITDKAPFTTLSQLDLAKRKVQETGLKWAVYYSERLHVESAVYAGQLIKAGAIGEVIQVIGLGPHKLSPELRPSWFFEKEKYGGILCDIGSHQIEQYLYYSGATDAKVVRSSVGNYANPAYPGLEDFGDAMLVGNNGSSNYFRVDWFTPDALPTWGDGRTMILGTKGYIELRKYIDIARDNTTDHVYLVNDKVEEHYHVAGKVGFPFFGELIKDCINKTENAMSQAHTWKAAELALQAQVQAEKLRG